MVLDDLWIGDEVLIKSSLEQGLYEGHNANGQQRIRIGQKIKLVNLEDLELAPKRKDEPELKLIETVKNEMKGYFDPEIDLHFEKLFPNESKPIHEMILRKQLEKCRIHVQRAIDRKVPIVTIIHGKGKGQLKLEVEHLLKEFEEMQFSLTKNNGGATEVWFKYQ